MSESAIAATSGLAAVNGATQVPASAPAEELVPTRVSLLLPGVIDTPAFDRIKSGNGSEVGAGRLCD